MEYVLELIHAVTWKTNSVEWLMFDFSFDTCYGKGGSRLCRASLYLSLDATCCLTFLWELILS